MDLNSKTYISVRGLIYIPFFLLLHYSFEWFPNLFLQIFSGIEESVYQHCKVGFYAYLILIVVEFAIFRKNINDASKFWWSRLMGALILPWFIILVWFIAPAVYGFIPILWLEILYANICVYITILSISIFERAFQEINFSTAMKSCLIILVLVMIMEFTIFSFITPWADLFAVP